jgi:AAA+ superfamily predicted ATPase
MRNPFRRKVPKKKQSPRKTDIPFDKIDLRGIDFGPGFNSRPSQYVSSSLKTEIHRLNMVQQREQAAERARRQQILNQQYQSQYNNQLAALQQRGSTPTANQLAQLLGVQQQPPVSKKPMEPPKYDVGSQVTIRTGKIVFTVIRSEWNSNYGYHLYYLEDAYGRQSRESENDLKEAGSEKTKVDFDTVIIADEKRAQILEALEQVNQMDLIFNKWGFGDTIEKGKGVSMLFYGPPGTGKTLMAQAIANKLEYKLRVISTADIESSAPGEAERNIRKHFKDAKGGKTILLFDECDSLIYTRQNVGPILSAQINELLSQIERFDGITLFTTNRLGTLDEAVNRRLALKLEFAMPSPEERAEIWKRMFPKQAPLDSKIDWMLLAEFEITGGYIKNAVLRAARMAATEKIPDEKKKIMMKHLKKALRYELESMMEFEDARAVESGKVGHMNRGKVAVGNSNGGRTIERTVEMKETVEEGGATT